MSVWQKNPVAVVKSVASDMGDDYLDMTIRNISLRAIENAFSKLKPRQEYIDTFAPWQELYEIDKASFIMSFPIHQSTNDAQLHISVEYASHKFAFTHRFHLYGTLNKGFYVSSITKSRADGSIMTIAEF